MARKHAKQSELRIDYQVAPGEKLPFPDASFDTVYYCDVLEHVNDVDRVVAEATRFLDRDLHAWHLFIKPRELTQILRRHGLQDHPYVGIGTGVNPIEAIRIMRRRRRGEMGFAEFARALALRESRDCSVSYACYATKSA